MAVDQLGAFPKPPVARSLSLPTGATLSGMVDLPKGVDDQCRVSFNLMLQLGPFLASIECLMHILQFCMWLLDFVKVVPDVIKMGKQLEKLPPIASDLAHCFSFVIPGLGICTFVKDILTLIRDYLRCLVELLDSVLTQQLELQIKIGDAQGNPELLHVLQLAQDNADGIKQQSLQSCAPAFDILKAVGVFLDMIGVGQLAVPSLDDLAGGELEAVLQPLKDLVDVLSGVIEALPC